MVYYLSNYKTYGFQPVKLIKEISTETKSGKLIILVNRMAKELYAVVSKLFNEEKTADKPAYLQSDFKAKDVQLGHSYFLVDTLSELNMKLEFEIKPILFEYVKDGVLSQEAEKEIKALKVNE